MVKFGQSNYEALVMSDWRNNPRTGKSTFMPLIGDIDGRLKLGETLKQIYESCIVNNSIDMSYPQFTRYVKKYCYEGQKSQVSKENSKPEIIHKDKKEDQSDNETSVDSGCLDEYMDVCFRQERIARRAIEKGVPLETIKEWKAPNKVRLGTLITNYNVKN